MPCGLHTRWKHASGLAGQAYHCGLIRPEAQLPVERVLQIQ